MTELEKKLLLTKDEYSHLLDLVKKDTATVRQVNYYFDTDDLSMDRQNITCRIRLKDGEYKGTLKRHTSDTDRSTETEVKVQNGIYNNTFTDMGLRLQGNLVTERRILLKDAICEVVLDKNEYLGHTDYELEIEYAPHHEKEAHCIFQAYLDILARQRLSPLPIPISIPSKSHRFFERKRNFKKNSNRDGSCQH